MPRAGVTCAAPSTPSPSAAGRQHRPRQGYRRRHGQRHRQRRPRQRHEESVPGNRRRRGRPGARPAGYRARQASGTRCRTPPPRSPGPSCSAVVSSAARVGRLVQRHPDQRVRDQRAEPQRQDPPSHHQARPAASGPPGAAATAGRSRARRTRRRRPGSPAAAAGTCCHAPAAAARSTRTARTPPRAGAKVSPARSALSPSPPCRCDREAEQEAAVGDHQHGTAGSPASSPGDRNTDSESSGSPPREATSRSV